MAELVDAADSKSAVRKDVQVRFLFRAQPTKLNTVKAFRGPRLDYISILFYFCMQITDHPLTGAAGRAKDFWYFTYLNNGINFKDIAKPKYKDIYKKQIHFNRSKTIRSSRDKDRTVIAALLKESERIIDKWGNPDKSPDNYVFPILTKDLTARRAHEVIQTHLQSINKYNKKLAITLKLGVDLTTIVARHSFASVMIENGVDLAILKELMGHSSITTTEIYVKPFNSTTRRRNALLLLSEPDTASQIMHTTTRRVKPGMIPQEKTLT
jgi:Phage integrase family